MISTAGGSLRRVVCLALVAALPLPIGCRALERKEARQIPQLGRIDPTAPNELRRTNVPSYQIEPPDELELEVRPDLGFSLPRIVTVRPDGRIDLGFAGDVYVAGSTLDGAERLIEGRLNVEALRRELEVDDPIEVSVRLASPSRSKYYYVIGTVNSQGPFPYTGDETVLKAILEAGLRSNSLPEKAYLVRPTPPGQPDKVLRIDWVGIKDRGDPTTNYQVFPGDRIIVPGTRPRGLLPALLGTN